MTGDNSDTKPARITKVLKLRILKPAGDMKWQELGALLREVRYRVFRLANLAVSEAYLDFHKARSGDGAKGDKISALNKKLKTILDEERKKGKGGDYSGELAKKENALASNITDALSQYKLKSATGKTKWSEITRGKSSLPTFKLDMAIPVRCDKPEQKRLEKTANGDVELDLMIRTRPYPRVVLATGYKALGDSARAILDRLLENKNPSVDGYRQRCFEIKEDSRTKQWFLLVTYDFPTATPTVKKEIVVGVDVGYGCPLFAALNNGHPRLGWKAFGAVGHMIKSLRSQTIKRRREMQRGGNTMVSGMAARSGHGRKRKLLSIEKLQGRIDRAQTTANHQMSAAVVKFAREHGAGRIQMEDLSKFHEELSGTFIGERWEYAQLQRFIEYKAKEAGIEVKKVNPKYTSRRCAKCGHIHIEFSGDYRKQNKYPKFKCPAPDCDYEADADYNAARNLAELDIEEKIQEQCNRQNIEYNEAAAKGSAIRKETAGRAAEGGLQPPEG